MMISEKYIKTMSEKYIKTISEKYIKTISEKYMYLIIQGVFLSWASPKKLKYGKPRLGESTLTQIVLDTLNLQPRLTFLYLDHSISKGKAWPYFGIEFFLQILCSFSSFLKQGNLRDDVLRKDTLPQTSRPLRCFDRFLDCAGKIKWKDLLFYVIFNLILQILVLTSWTTLSWNGFCQNFHLLPLCKA